MNSFRVLVDLATSVCTRNVEGLAAIGFRPSLPRETLFLSTSVKLPLEISLALTSSSAFSSLVT